MKRFQLERTDKTLLLVDDEPANLRALGSYLETPEFELIMALGGASALEKARRGHPDLIVLNTTMSLIGGLETCRQLKADPALQDIPVIFLCTLEEIMDRAHCFEAGGADFITKPIQREDLLARIGIHLSLRDLQARLWEQKRRFAARAAGQLVDSELQARLLAQNRRLQQKNAEMQRALERYAIAQHALGESDERNQLLLNSIHEGIFSLDLEGLCTFCNQPATKLLGYTDPQQIVGTGLHALTHHTRADGTPYPAEKCPICAPYLYGEKTTSSDVVFWRADGTNVPVEFHASSVRHEGRIVGSVVSFRDISERLETEQALRLGATVLDASDEAVMFCDERHQVILVNATFSKITGFSRAEILGRIPMNFLSPRAHKQGLYGDIWRAVDATGTWRGEMLQRRKNGEVFLSWVNVSQVKDTHNRLTHYVTVFSDISEIKHSHSRMEHLAHHDSLTGLPNRLLLHDRLRHAIEKARRNRNAFAVLFIDLDQFKQVNDTLGHAMGDQLLQEVARRLLLLIRRSDTIARIGGDEFVLLLEEISKPQDANQIAQKVIDQINRPVQVKDHDLHVGASVGISLYPQDGQDADELLRIADIAMYAAKQESRNSYRFYTPGLSDEQQRPPIKKRPLQQASSTAAPPATGQEY